MISVSFTVPGLPVAMPRQRHRIVQHGGKVFASNYTPSKDPVNDYKAAVRYAAAMAHKGPPLAGPLGMDMLFVFPRSKGLTWTKRVMNRIWSAKKPDGDNLWKSTADCLNGLLYVDDAQLADVRVRKVIASGDEQTRAEIVVWQMDHQCSEEGGME